MPPRDYRLPHDYSAVPIAGNPGGVIEQIGVAGADRVFAGLAPLYAMSGEGPKGFLGRVAGLGAYELRAGVPAWAWVGVGAIAGATVVWVYGGRLKEALR